MAERRDLMLKITEKEKISAISNHENLEKLYEYLSKKIKSTIITGPKGSGKKTLVSQLRNAVLEGDTPQGLVGELYQFDIAQFCVDAKEFGVEMVLVMMKEQLEKNRNSLIIVKDANFIKEESKLYVPFLDILGPSIRGGEINILMVLEPPMKVEDYPQLKGVNLLKMEGFNRETMEKVLDLHSFLSKPCEVTSEAKKALLELSEKYLKNDVEPGRSVEVLQHVIASEKIKRGYHMDYAGGDTHHIKDALLIGEEFPDDSIINKVSKAYSGKLETINPSDIMGGDEFIRGNSFKMVAQILEKEFPKNIVIGKTEVEMTISQMTGIPVGKITKSDQEKLKELEGALGKMVHGQDLVISQVAAAIKRSRLQLRQGSKPQAVFLFAGPTGTGKTETAKSLASYMFGKKNLIRFDMTEYMEDHTVSRLFGSPPGYVGHEEGGQLTEAVKKHPFSVILFDEVEKAAPMVFNTMLQVFDDGRMTDGQGTTVDFSNTFIIMTSNLCTDKLGEVTDDNLHEKQKILMGEVNKFFKPEFVNRLDGICLFKSLGFDTLKGIAKKKLHELGRILKEKHNIMELDWDPKVPEFLASRITQGKSSTLGARPLDRIINTLIVDQISEVILGGAPISNMTIFLNSDGGLSLKA
jgi:ATP-dependent Clp protease ATP-binding subunit ClpC